MNGLTARDEESGEEFKINARIVVNATGVFTDSVRRMADPAAEQLVVTSQGIHLVFDPSFLRSQTALMVPKTSDGRVLFAGRRGGYGNLVELDHARGITTVYGHLSRFASGLRPGQHVTQGQVIAFVGMTGFGASGAYKELYSHFGITADKVAQTALTKLKA